ncbi:MAG: type IX secretion system membrane protein PorP/SprF [Flavobacteriaceae bacterium]|nr:type IX secretion system membrane protein PorP/SprF [Flavobacteriaceae bacterium]
MKNIFAIVITILVSTGVWSQQDPHYTQYMYNMSVINPAYTTSTEGIINIGGIHRSQWVGVDGAPKTSSIFLHTPINDKIETGFSLVNDNIGDIVKENNLYADLAYKLDFEEKGILSFGLKAGVTFFDVDFTGLEFKDTGDLAFENINEMFFNMGAGVYFNTDKYYVGLSVPNFIPSNHLEEDSGQYQGVEQAHWFLTGGYVFDINEQFKFKPAFMTKAVKGASMSLDLTANVLFNEKFELGIGYRLDDAISGLASFMVTPEFRIGYAYDHTTSNLGTYSNGSHEIILLYNLNILTKGFDKSPRFF